MVRRAAAVLGAVLMVVLAAVSIVVIGIRTKVPAGAEPSPALRPGRR
jgi:hypothetical protein